MGWPFVRRRMASELGPDWPAKFRCFEHEAARAASLGQVHRAVALDGRALACKLQYPDMASAVEADLSQLRLVMSLYERYDRAITTDEIHAEIAERLREELDYKREAAHMRLYRLMHADEPDVAIPEPVAELSTARLLTMNWLEGAPFLEAVKTAPAARRNDIARHMFRAWYVPFYYYGVNLLDFGCVRIFPAPFVEGVIDLYHALDRDDPALAVKAYESWGFHNLSREMIATLNRWANFLYAPLLDDRKRRIQETEGAYGRDVAEEV